MTRPTYKVTVERDGRWWYIRVPAVRGAFTQAHRLDEVEEMTRDLLGTLLEVAPESFDLDVTVSIPTDIRIEIDQARTLQAQAESTKAEAAELIRDAARRLHDDQGLTMKEVAAVLGVSFQRVSQLIGKRAS